MEKPSQYVHCPSPTFQRGSSYPRTDGSFWRGNTGELNSCERTHDERSQWGFWQFVKIQGTFWILTNWLPNRASNKLDAGNVRVAVRVLSSDDRFFTPNCCISLSFCFFTPYVVSLLPPSYKPGIFTPYDRRSSPADKTGVGRPRLDNGGVKVNQSKVNQSNNIFAPKSTAGWDSLRPLHLQDMLKNAGVS